MAKTSVEYREERGTLINEARKSWNEAEAREGGPTDDDKAKFDRAMDQADDLLAKAKRIERLESAEQDLDEPQGRASDPIEDRETRDRSAKPSATERSRANFRHWMQTGEVRAEMRPDPRRLAELRDTVISTDSKGGFLILPVEISSDITSIVEDLVFIRQLCQAAGSVITVTNAKKLGIRKKTAHMNDADWTTEVQAVTEDTGMALDRRDLQPNLMTKLALVSIETLILAADAETEVTGELGYKFGTTEEKGFLTGNGTGQPLGVFTASASGISTARDVTASAVNAFTADNLIDMKYSLKQAYQRDKSTAWMLSREFVKRARKLKVASTTGGNDLEYIWQPGLTEGAPDRILDIPYCMSEYVPNTFTTGLYVAVLGAFRYFKIAQLKEVAIQRLVERYADTNQVGFIGRRWVDGSVVQEEAFARLKLA